MAVNCTVAASLRQRDPMPFAVVTGGVTSPGEGEAVGVTVGTASGAAMGSDSGGVVGTVVTADATLTMPGKARPTAAMRMSRWRYTCPSQVVPRPF